MLTATPFNSLAKTMVDLFFAAGPRLFLTNTAPVATQTGFLPGSLHPPPAQVFGYPPGGPVLTSLVSTTVSTNDATGTSAQVTVTATGGSIGPMQYVGLYLDTLAGGPLVVFWNLGAPLTLTDGQSKTFKFSGLTNGILMTVAA